MVGNKLCELIYHLTGLQSAEEQLNRQLDWCIEQLELGMKSLKATPKQSIHLLTLDSKTFFGYLFKSVVCLRCVRACLLAWVSQK